MMTQQTKDKIAATKAANKLKQQKILEKKLAKQTINQQKLVVPSEDLTPPQVKLTPEQQKFNSDMAAARLYLQTDEIEIKQLLKLVNPTQQQADRIAYYYKKYVNPASTGNYKTDCSKCPNSLVEWWLQLRDYYWKSTMANKNLFNVQ